MLQINQPVGCIRCRSSSTQRSVPRLLTRTPTKMEHKQPIIVEYKEETEEHRQLRRVAFFAIVISTAAVIVSIVTLPMLYSYVAGFQSHLIQETEFCKTRSRDMWTEMSILHQQGHSSVRAKRQYGNSPQPAPSQAAGGYGPAANPETAPSCCSCQQGLQDQLDLLVMPESQEAMAPTDKTAIMAVMEPCSRAPFLTSHVLSAHQDHQETKAHRAKRDPVDPKELPGRTGRTETKEMLVSKDPLDSKDRLGHQDLTDPLELQEDSSRSTAQPDHKEPQEHQELPAKRVFPAKTAPTLVAELVQLETMEHQDLKEARTSGTPGPQGPNGEPGSCEHCPPPRTPPGY
uniref:Nematode cuticle collagen N-terminal domain-containing protein n=1 Tax=Ditylenchus dipsaci TaxID=166011 RepID=A0A915DGZ5_9BILA